MRRRGNARAGDAERRASPKVAAGGDAEWPCAELQGVIRRVNARYSLSSLYPFSNFGKNMETVVGAEGLTPPATLATEIVGAMQHCCVLRASSRSRGPIQELDGSGGQAPRPALLRTGQHVQLAAPWPARHVPAHRGLVHGLLFPPPFNRRGDAPHDRSFVWSNLASGRLLSALAS